MYKSPFFFHPFTLLKLIARVRLRHFFQIPTTLEKVKRTLGYEPLSPASVEQGGPCLVFRHESHDREWATIDPIDLSAWSTKSFIELIFKSHSFSLKQLHWIRRKLSIGLLLSTINTAIEFLILHSRLNSIIMVSLIPKYGMICVDSLCLGVQGLLYIALAPGLVPQVRDLMAPERVI